MDKIIGFERLVNYSELLTPFGRIGLHWESERLLRVDLLARVNGQSRRMLTPEWLEAELGAYFRDPTYRIVCPVDTAGTPFQQSVWEQIAAIPAGDTVTYGRIAEALHSSPRAVGNACRANPVPLRVPCHRVVGATGLGGFAGERGGELLQIKRWLLTHEAAAKKAREGNEEDGA
jgi:methylated-DNA-[protein]-cysteine S-methyltransferase